MRSIAAAALSLVAMPVAAQRVELPVRLMTLSDGERRFAVTLTIDGRRVEAGLDTGSTGLRVMARAIPGVPASGRSVHYGYGAGTQLDGQLVHASVSFGPSLAGDVPIERVDHLSCLPGKPRCPVARNADPQTFGIQGDGLRNEGFAAILGVNLRAAPVGNPFKALGVRRWIVELPRPGESAPGRLILNPNETELTGYQRLRFASDDNGLPTCIEASGLDRLCGPATIDSGAPGLRVVTPQRRAPVPDGTLATITIGGTVQLDVAIGRRDQASHLSIAQGDGPRLFLGIAPYFRWSVLYDADAHEIGFKPR